jgi:DNA repair photolyase
MSVGCDFLKISEINVDTILNNVAKSEYSDITGPGIDYTLDPYVGCEHACKYCYVFRRQFVDDPSHSGELWGDFVEPKINAPEILKNELKENKPGVILLSSITDPYQPSEYKYRITRGCLEKIAKSQYKVVILTKSSLVTRDMDIISNLRSADVGLSITTDDDDIRNLIEPNSTSIEERISTLQMFHSRKIRTYAHIGPILPMNPIELVNMLKDHIDYAIIDRMNYISSDLEELYQRNGFGYALGDDYFKSKDSELRKYFERANVRIW